MFRLGRSKWLNFMLWLVLFGGVTAGLIYYLSLEKGPIYEYDAKRDKKDILSLFDANWYWLINVPRGHYSPEFTFKYKTPKRDPRYFGKLIIKVLRENNEFVGFTAYYKVSFYKGQFLFLAVDKAFRGKGVGTKLARYAVEDLFKRGCSVVFLWTRPNNPARFLYKKLGFKKKKIDGELVYFSVTKDEYYKAKKEVEQRKKGAAEKK